MPRSRNDQVVDDVELIDLEQEEANQSNQRRSGPNSIAGGVRVQQLVAHSNRRRGENASREDRVTVLSDTNPPAFGQQPAPRQHPYREDATALEDSVGEGSARYS